MGVAITSRLVTVLKIHGVFAQSKEIRLGRRLGRRRTSASRMCKNDGSFCRNFHHVTPADNRRGKTGQGLRSLGWHFR